jgi:hypothetical protein
VVGVAQANPIKKKLRETAGLKLRGV